MSYEEDFQKWMQSAERTRIRALSSLILDLLQAAKKENMTFPEIMTSLDTAYIEVAARHSVPPEDFDRGVKLACKHYKETYKRMMENHSEKE